MSFKANIGENESLMRLIGGAVLMALAFLAGGVLQWIILLVGLYLISTGIIRFCPAYHYLKMSTAAKK